MKGKLWGGRFKKDLDRKALEYTESVKVDSIMILEDIWGSQAHAIMLAKQGIIDGRSLKKIVKALEKVRRNFKGGRFKLKRELEDVHMNVESYLIEEEGAEVGGKLHTARSRNDQVLVDTRLVTRKKLLQVTKKAIELEETLIRMAEKHSETVMPGYTHGQHAQPITLGFWAASYASALDRDLARMEDAFGRVNLNPLGACALAGTSYPIDRKVTTKLLGFGGIAENALDAVGSRDFILEVMSCLAILMSTLSKLAEDIILWSTQEFSLIELDDSYTTGSSIMPQKKNPDVAELLRGRTSKVYGVLLSLLTTMKGLPSGYSRDLQEDKPLLFESFRTVDSSIEVMNGMLSTVKVNRKAMAKSAGEGFSTATELADYLVLKEGIAFRDSHRIVGSIVKSLSTKRKSFEDTDTVSRLLKEHGISIDAKVLNKVLSPEYAVNSHRSLGGTSPPQVRRTASSLLKKLAGHRSFAVRQTSNIVDARKKTEEIIRKVSMGADIRRIRI
ncbi:MAG: argininosuccinate lyase [Candidatus Altiarchaeota archaeon]